MIQDGTPSVFDPYLTGGTMAAEDPNSYGAKHGAASRDCGLPWPCPDRYNLHMLHSPRPIPNGAVVSTRTDLLRLINWAPTLAAPVVLDRYGHTWILFESEDGDLLAGTVEFPEEEVPARCEVDYLAEHWGSLRVLFNGDLTALENSEDQR